MKESTQELIARIRENSELTNEEKSQLINALRKKKRYGIVWEDRKEESWINLMTNIPVLEEVKERAVISEEEGSPDHILIEGDNIDALVALTYTHEGKIDVIYIDPPYNTGNKDFIYNDCFIDKDNPYRHSSWLSFISKRLKIAKRLLSDKGVIFISIDDNEQAQLKMLCDEILGENNYISTLPRITKASGKTTDKIAQNHDYVLIFAKDESLCTITGIPHDDAGFKNKDEFYSKRGKYKLNQTLDYNSLSYDANLDYPITIDGETFYPGGDYEKHLKRLKGNHKRADWAWRWSKELFQFGFNNGFIVVKAGRNGKRIYTKTYQRVTIEKTGNGYQLVEKDRLKPVQSIQLIENCFSNDNAKKELEAIFEDIPFDYPKPTSIMHYMLQTIPKCSTILDFFAGSGTTLHATMALNAEDGGHRQCILVTNNENRICEDVTYVRNRKVIEGYTNQKGETVKGLTANSLRYYRTKFIGREKTMKNGRDLALAATELVCIREGAYRERPQFGRLRLKPSVARCFEGKGKLILLIFNDAAIEPLADEMSTMDKSLKFKVYTLAPGDYAYDDEFEKIADRVELCPIPSSIYNAYDKVLPKKDTYTDGQDDAEEDGTSAEQDE